MDKATCNKRFGEYLKILRKNRRMSQVQLADLIGNNFQNISSLERGEFSPSLFYLLELSKALSVSLEELMRGFESHSLLSDKTK